MIGSPKYNTACIIMATFVLSFADVTQSALNYPIHLGAFSGDTDLQGFAFDSVGNLAVTGFTTDTALVGTATPTHFVMYHQPAGSTWLWAR